MGRPRTTLVGQRNGLLVVIEELTNKHRPLWRCRCDCGRDYYLRTGHFKRQTHCGCLTGYTQARWWEKSEDEEIQQESTYQENAKKKNIKRRADRKANPDKYRAYDRKKRHRLTPEQFEQLLELQGHRCLVCKTTKPGGAYDQWHIDHDHKCCPNRGRACGGCIRGILCSNCNLTLGNAQDDPRILRALAQYLEDYAKRAPIEIL